MRVFRESRLAAVALVLTGYVCLAFGARPQADASSRGRSPAPKYGVDIALPGGNNFYIPVAGKGQMLGALPLSGGRFAAIRIVPRVQGSSVRIDVSALVAGKDSLSGVTCRELQDWRGEPAGSYVGKPGESLALVGLKTLGLRSLKVKITTARAALTGAPGAAFCGCGPMTSFPNPGMCMGMAGCGVCCAAPRQQRPPKR